MDRSLPGDEDGLAPDRRVGSPGPSEPRGSDASQGFSLRVKLRRVTARRSSERATGLRRERRSLAFLVIAALVPFFLLAAWAKFDSPAPWEPGIMVALASRDDLVGAVTGAINTLGNLPVWAVAVAITAILVSVARGVIAGALVALSFASDLAAFAVKIVVERDRPETAATKHFFGPDAFSYPSGHTVRAAALVAVTLWVIAPPRWRLPLAVAGGVIAGVVMGFARVSLGVHWPTDTFGGMLLGLGWFGVTAWIAVKSLRSGTVTCRRGAKPAG
jgi:membrane-associated phospholipid phosphatase